MSIRRGMAGLIVMVLVLGYMMSISTSHTLLISSENVGKAARSSYKKAHYAAMAGIGIVMGRLRTDSTDTFNANYQNRPYFVRDVNDSANHYQQASNSIVNFSAFSKRHAAGWLALDAPDFATNTLDIDKDNYEVIICSYPGYQIDPEDEKFYYVKCQGRFTDGETSYTAQIWAKFVVNAPARLIALDSYNTMNTQSLDVIPTPAIEPKVNDFWDWQNKF